MKPAAKILFLFYVLFTLLDLLFIFLRADDLRWVSKPLLMPFLMAGYTTNVPIKKGNLFWLILLALFLSWCGDVLLLAEGLFIPGLLSFLLAHIAYIFYFTTAGRGKKGWLQQSPLPALPVIVYVVLLLWLLFPFLGTLKIPVIIYGLAIGTMLLTAMNTRCQLPKGAFTCFFAGALLFVLSDSVLAFHLFVLKQPLLGLAVMTAYAAAQYLIVRGALVKANLVLPVNQKKEAV